MENHCIEEPFIIRSYRKSELAHLYNPDMPLVPAMRKMRYWIQRNPELYEAMYGREKQGETTAIRGGR